MNNFNWGFTTVSWGTHIMLMLDYDKDTGDIIYAHSVGPFKGVQQGIVDPRPFRFIVGPSDNKDTYFYNKESKLFERYKQPTNSFSPYLNFRRNSKDVDRSYISMVNWLP
jgi:hypothetical protein